MAKRILLGIVACVAVVIAFPYIKQFFDIFLASGGVLAGLPNMTAWELFFFRAIPYAMLFGVPILVLIMIFRKRGGA